MRINERLQEAAQAIDELIAYDRAEAAERYQRLRAVLQDRENAPSSGIKVDSPTAPTPTSADIHDASVAEPEQSSRAGLTDRQWTTTSPEHFDRLARAVLRAAREAAQELRREPPEPDRRMWALGKLAGQAQEMLGPDLPDHPPTGAAAQEEFVRTALALAVHVRAHSWATADLGSLGVLGQADVPHSGERRASDAFDVLGRLMLPHSSPDGWTATLVTDLARGDEGLEAAVKLGKYVLHPTFLAFVDDATRVLGEALHSIDVNRLRDLTRLLGHYSDARPSHPVVRQVPTSAAGVPEPKSFRQPMTQPDGHTPDRRYPRLGTPQRMDRTEGPADSPEESKLPQPPELAASAVPVFGDERVVPRALNLDQDETMLGPVVDWPDDLDPDTPGRRNIGL
ncbi:hypothetical protein ACIRU8_44955 [Streptomyces sp. NPDC101175]|uniref:hypothetical protein n=1 Tax=Streptomyces sp. NPDC101175 TaxID=3366123 RepID=UPI0038354E5C